LLKRKRDAVQKQKETALNLKVSETEMKALRSQMNPHFIFNALQSIQTFLMNHKPEEANVYLLKFSKLMRLVLENSEYPEVPVKEDVQALELYMQLESIRLRHPFTYQINIDSTIDPESDTILPLILQPFVENAIWHGLQYKPVAGHIDISLSKKGNILYASVTDNGVGRTAKHESLGIKLTQDRLNTLNETRHVDANFTITDLFDEQQQPAGTKVELSLPLGG
jgi:sensor histidine kinase YesM